MFVRTATPNDALDVRRILDAAMLDPGDVEARTAAGDVLVAGDRAAATSDGSAPPEQFADTPDQRTDAPDQRADVPARRERILGAVVLEPRESGARVVAIGVRRRHRDRGVGRALVERALAREGALTARFDARVRPFYESLGFSIEPIDGDRFRGRRSA